MVTAQALAAVVCGGAVGAGCWLLADAVRGVPAGRRATPFRRALGKLAGMRRLPAGVVVGMLVLLVTRWPVAALAGTVLVVAWPWLFGGAAAERAQVARLEGLARWAEALGDTIAGAAGLEHAIPATVTAAPPELRPQVALLAERLRSRMPVEQALYTFADDLDDPAGDLLVAPLLLSAQLRGPGLREVLASLARITRDQVAARHRIAAQRAVTRRGTKVIVVFSAAVMVGTAVLNRDFVAPYTSATGQLVLAVVTGLAASSFAVTRRVAHIATPGRFLRSPDTEPAQATDVDQDGVR